MNRRWWDNGKGKILIAVISSLVGLVLGYGGGFLKMGVSDHFLLQELNGQYRAHDAATKHRIIEHDKLNLLVPQLIEQVKELKIETEKNTKELIRFRTALIRVYPELSSVDNHKQYGGSQ